MKNYLYAFTTKKSAHELFDLLQDIGKWWSGIYEETSKGESQKLNDEFSFSASGGMHFSKQKLVLLIPNKKIVWQVTESNLSFLKNPEEWKNTKLTFDISETKNETTVTFTHEGSEPNIECYGSCSNAWTQYLQNLETTLNG